MFQINVCWVYGFAHQFGYLLVAQSNCLVCTATTKPNSPQKTYFRTTPVQTHVHSHEVLQKDVERRQDAKSQRHPFFKSRRANAHRHPVSSSTLRPPIFIVGLPCSGRTSLGTPKMDPGFPVNLTFGPVNRHRISRSFRTTISLCL